MKIAVMRVKLFELARTRINIKGGYDERKGIVIE